MKTEELKTWLKTRPGFIRLEGRRAGKTTAIMEVIHEKHGGNAVYLTKNWDLAHSFQSDYRAQYPQDAVPVCIAKSGLERLRGQSKDIYGDEIDLDLSTHLWQREFAGGFVS